MNTGATLYSNVAKITVTSIKWSLTEEIFNKSWRKWVRHVITLCQRAVWRLILNWPVIILALEQKTSSFPSDKRILIMLYSISVVFIYYSIYYATLSQSYLGNQRPGWWLWQWSLSSFSPQTRLNVESGGKPSNDLSSFIRNENVEVLVPAKYLKSL